MAEQYVPSEPFARSLYVLGSRNSSPDISADQARAEFDRFLARVKRDAVEQFIEACKEKRDSPGFLLPRNYWEDIDAAIRVAESYVKNYPETED